MFVKTSEKQFEARRVHVRRKEELMAFIDRGLKDGERVATTGAFLLKTEILRGQIGAG